MHWRDCDLNQCAFCHPVKQQIQSDHQKRVAQGVQNGMQVGSELHNDSASSTQEKLSNLQVDFARLVLTSSNEPATMELD